MWRVALLVCAVLFGSSRMAFGQDVLPIDGTLAPWEQDWLTYCQSMACVSTDTALWNIRDFTTREVPQLDTAEIKMRMALLDGATSMDLSWNPVAHSRIAFYADRRNQHLGKMLGRTPLYFPLFEAELDRHDLPLELKYLPVVESGLNPNARSHVGARGLWQFMYATAKGQQLRIDSYIDERRDPVRSTKAACAFLKKLHKTYGDWYLALAAYNAGPGNVNKAIRRSGGKRSFWEIRHFLPRETRNYVPAFMAVVYLMEFHSEHNIYPLDIVDFRATIDTVNVRTVLRFDQIAAFTGMNTDQIAALNPMYRMQIIPGPPEHWPLYLPQTEVPSFLMFQDSMLTHKPDQTPEIIFVPEAVTYRVKSGDVLGGIAQKYGVSVRQLREWNDLSSTLIRVGQKLRIHADVSKL